MKFSDEAVDVKNNKLLGIFANVICVVFTLLVSVVNGDAACIFLSIIIGTGLSKKIDAINHIIAAILFIILLAIIGFPEFSWLCLIICIFANLIDELGNDKYDEKIENNSNVNETLLDKFFKYRCALKVTVLILSLLGLVNVLFTNTIISGIMFFQPLTVILFYIFDFSYEMAGKSFEGIYNTFQSILG
ncbi:MAG: hypothetical protein E7Z84_00230 [Methanosphaera stadtmanae]|nr:hypothetical protein [Methanosphaera stadtmanae]